MPTNLKRRDQKSFAGFNISKLSPNLTQQQYAEFCGTRFDRSLVLQNVLCIKHDHRITQISYDLCSYECSFFDCIWKREKFRTSMGFESVTLQGHWFKSH